MINKQLEINNISSKLMDSFGDMITIMHSDVNADKLVMRIRFKDLKQDEDNESVVGFLKEIEDTLLNELSLKGFPEIAKVYAKKYHVDYKKTISNDIIEILNVLGIEAVRMALINELRAVLNFYGIYVNYRHIATLCDVMTHKGKLTSITRHGINRLDCGPLRKCSFEETVEILLEAAVYNENDMLKGITENIILGQLAPFGTGSFDLVLDS
jgi:DNA-directed RNA polymerase II subunit RPB1